MFHAIGPFEWLQVIIGVRTKLRMRVHSDVYLLELPVENAPYFKRSNRVLHKKHLTQLHRDNKNTFLKTQNYNEGGYLAMLPLQQSDAGNTGLYWWNGHLYDSLGERDQRPKTDEEWTKPSSSKSGGTKRYTYSPEDWEIVPQPTRPSGKPFHGYFAHHKEFFKVEWPEQVPSFPRFSELACELQIQIWEYALPGPGIIDLHIRQRRGPGYCSYVLTTDKHTLASRQAHLQTCCLSRDVFLKHYHPLRLQDPPDFAPSHEIWLQLQPPVIYINETHDTLILDCNVLQRFEARGGHMDLSKLQHLALKEFGMATSGHIYLEKTFPSLKTITHILNHDILSTKNVKTLRDFGFRGKMSQNPKHNFQLINVGGSLERSDIFWDNPESVLQSDFSGSPKRVLKKWWEIMEKARSTSRFASVSNHNSNISQEKWKPAKSRFCLLAREDDLDWWSSEVLYLIPRGKENDKNDDVAYYTLRPKAPFKKRTPRLLIEDERWEPARRHASQGWILAKKHCGFFLGPRGENLEDLYDGIPALFGEEVPEEGEVQNELVFTAKCDYDEFEQLVYIPQTNQRSSEEARSSYVYCQKYGSPHLERREWKSISEPEE
ncbi:hypothetical protein HYFRA_00002825 [Hymenoscyphus fraxineus]|uniref:2EXR domain-containing protein n=1 Tax=Hymenoscyphus fraxineus TaxID=746836 RepID=A0A9N9PL22_9HELO|nr:hypothetical protein HYFRA_00002825 [Hymenoscyphus fraxineus]